VFLHGSGMMHRFFISVYPIFCSIIQRTRLIFLDEKQIYSFLLNFQGFEKLKSIFKKNNT